MIAVLESMIFASALVMAVAVIAGMIAPQWQRIARLAAGYREQAFAPLTQLAVAERHIAVRRWSTEPRTALAVNPLRAAA